MLACAATPLHAAKPSKGRTLKVRIYERGSSTPTVLVNMPMSLVSAFMRVAARADTHARIDLSDEGGEATRVRVEDVDILEALRELEAMEPGQIVEIQDGEERVSVWIE